MLFVELQNFKRVLSPFSCVFQLSFIVGIIITFSHSFLMNNISEVDYSRQVLEPKSIFSKAFQVSGNRLAASVHLLFITFMLLPVKVGVTEWKEAGE